MSRIIPLFLMLALFLSCSSKSAEGDKSSVESKNTDVPDMVKLASLDTPEGILFSIYPWRYTNALRPGDSLELVFQCYNKSSQPVDGAKIFRESLLVLHYPDKTVVQSDEEFLGIWQKAGTIEPGASYGPPVDIAKLFAMKELGEYSAEWEVGEYELVYPLKVMEGTDYFLYRLKNDTCYNDWSLHMYGEDGIYSSKSLAGEAIALGNAMVPGLQGFLGDTREAFVEGSEDATIASMYGWRVCDFAAIMLIEILKQEPGGIRSTDTMMRDKRITELEQWLSENGE
jgi:hypothetical protein